MTHRIPLARKVFGSNGNSFLMNNGDLQSLPFEEPNNLHQLDTPLECSLDLSGAEGTSNDFGFNQAFFTVGNNLCHFIQHVKYMPETLQSWLSINYTSKITEGGYFGLSFSLNKKRYLQFPITPFQTPVIQS